MSRNLRPALVNWSDLPARARQIRERHESGNAICDVIYIFDPRRIAEKVNALAPGAGGGDVCNALGWLARIWVRYPRDGAGRLQVLAQVDRGPEEYAGWFYGSASGYGYDKLTAALDGCPIPLAGITLGDHCNRENNPTLAGLRALGLVVFGG